MKFKKDKILALGLPGIDFIETQTRYYPNGNFLSYAIGYAKTDSSGEITGEMGIEKQYDDILSGTDGYVTYQKKTVTDIKSVAPMKFVSKQKMATTSI